MLRIKKLGLKRKSQQQHPAFAHLMKDISGRTGVLSNDDQGTCLEWIEKLLLDNNVQQHDIDSTRNMAELQYSIMKSFKYKN